MSTDDNINAGISVLVDTDMSLDHLDGILTTLRKHGLSPRYFEYEPELDAPKAGIALTSESKLPEIASEFKVMRDSKDGGVVRLPKTVTFEQMEDGFWKVTETTTDDDGTTTTETVTDEKH